MKLLIRTLCFLWILPLTLTEDTSVICLYSKECVLPCQSNLHDIIHWYKEKNAVHSFYDNKDQLEYQAQEYKDRTQLFPSEINNGNISLLLKKIRIQDEGRYKCYTASDIINEEKYVVASVVAPVKSVDITLRGDTVTCNTSGVYPQPLVSWSSDLPAEEPVNIYNKTDENLFVVTSELKIGSVNHAHTYNCSIINQKDKKTLYTASLKQQEISVQDEVTLQCPIIKDNPTVLTFSTTILRYDSQTSETQIHDEWKDKVNFSPENGMVKLHHLNTEHLGTYTCESSTAQTRYIIRTTVTQTGVTAHTALAIVIPLLIILIIVIVIYFLIKKQLLCCNKKTQSADNGTKHANGTMLEEHSRKNTTEQETQEREPLQDKDESDGTGGRGR